MPTRSISLYVIVLPFSFLLPGCGKPASNEIAGAYACWSPESDRATTKPTYFTFGDGGSAEWKMSGFGGDLKKFGTYSVKATNLEINWNSSESPNLKNGGVVRESEVHVERFNVASTHKASFILDKTYNSAMPSGEEKTYLYKIVCVTQ